VKGTALSQRGMRSSGAVIISSYRLNAGTAGIHRGSAEYGKSAAAGHGKGGGKDAPQQSRTRGPARTDRFGSTAPILSQSTADDSGLLPLDKAEVTGSSPVSPIERSAFAGLLSLWFKTSSIAPQSGEPAGPTSVACVRSTAIYSHPQIDGRLSAALPTRRCWLAWKRAVSATDAGVGWPRSRAGGRSQIVPEQARHPGSYGGLLAWILRDMTP
jgi:hypothetical protein